MIKDLDNEMTIEQQEPGSPELQLCSFEQQPGSPEQPVNEQPETPLDRKIEELGNEIVNDRTIHVQGCLGMIDINDPDNAARAAGDMAKFGEEIEQKQKEYLGLLDERKIQTYEGMSTQIQHEIDKTTDSDKIEHYHTLQGGLQQKIDEIKYK